VAHGVAEEGPARYATFEDLVLRRAREIYAQVARRDAKSACGESQGYSSSKCCAGRQRAPVSTAQLVKAILAAGGHGQAAKSAVAPRVRGNLAYQERRGFDQYGFILR
jgi:hypothetical protein